MKQYDETKFNYKGKLAIEYMLDALNEYKAEAQKFQEMAKKDFKILPYLPYNFHTYKFNFTQKDNSVWGPRSTPITREASQGVYDSYSWADKIELIDEMMAKDSEIKKQNEEISKNNLAVYNNLMGLIKEIGLETRCRDEKSRARIRPYIDCPFVGELKAKCLTYHNFDVVNNWNNFKNGILKQIAAKQALVDAEIQKKQVEEKEQAKIKLYIELIKKYNLDFASGIPSDYEIMEKILQKDKYLYLAHYMGKNRSDWTDGCDYAKTGLEGFKVENDIDKLIFAEVNDAVANWDGDGRVFRDLENFSYGAILQLVDKDILADYNKLIQYNNE